MPAANKSKAIDKLSPSALDTNKQMQMLGGDVDIDDFHLQIQQGAGLDITQCITDAVVDRTIEGASTLTITCDDTDDRSILTSGRIGKRVDINIDGLWWTLVAVKKAGRVLTLTFEEREINLLRRYDKPIFASRNQVTRAQFVLRMIREVQEEHLKWCIPELKIKQAVSDLQQNQVLVDATGKPVTSGTDIADATTSSGERGKGIPVVAGGGAKLTVKGVTATREQIKNANIILAVADQLNAPRKVMVASIMTAIAESTIHNLTGGDRDSVGVFQQRASQGWPASRNVATDAAAFLRAAISINAEPQYAGVSDAVLCQAVQHSAFPDGSNYAPYQTEGEAFVDSFDRNPTSTEAASLATTSKIANSTQMFMRGQITKAKGMSAYVLTPENSWNCTSRLAQEVNWRAFCVSGTIYFISDHWLMKSKPFDTISEDTEGIDWIDCDYDEGKPRATVTVTAHLERWASPPGSTVQIEDMGILDGKWLVDEVSRSIFDTLGTITLIKPLPLLPEPVALSGVPANFGAKAPSTANKQDEVSIIGANAVQKKVVAYAQSQLGVKYVWGADAPGVAFDCSGLTEACYNSVGISLPHNAQAQYDHGFKLSKVAVLEPGDLVFFGGSVTTIEHVGVYIGGGAMIDAPHTGANVRVDKDFRNWTNPAYVAASRPWATHG